MTMQLYIGNKNYSSWSMRAWVLMRQLGIEFDEIKLRLDLGEGSPFRLTVDALSPAGRVPVLVHDGFAVWDTLAIAEYLHERFPHLGVWPAKSDQRARARSLCAEMHSGFAALRNLCPMNIEAALGDVGRRLWSEQPGLRQDVARVERMWADAIAASGGPMLFGRFSAVDAFYAPVCARLRSYALPVGDPTRRYMASVDALAAVQQWTEAALGEHDFLEIDEPYRRAGDLPAGGR